MLSAVKEILTGHKPDAVDAARRALDQRCAELERVESQNAGQIAEARDLFEAEGSPALADTLVQRERRAEIFLRRARDRVADAQEKLAIAEREAIAERVAELDAIVTSLGTRVVALFPRARPHLEALLAVVRERDAMIAEAEKAAQSAARLRGLDYSTDHIRILPIQARRGALCSSVKAVIGALERDLIKSLLE